MWKNSTTNGRVVVVGSLNIDDVLRVSAFPRPGETVSANATWSNPGGKGGNQAVAAASAGVETLLVGAVGDDDDGKRYLRHLRAGGVNTEFVATAKNSRTGSATVVVDGSGQNSIVVAAGANGTLSAESLRLPQLRRSDVVLMQLEIPLSAVRATLLAANRCNARTIVNASPMTDEATPLICGADLVIVNEIEAMNLGDGARDICVTRGERGALWGDVSLPSEVVEVVDTTGAGDVFAGALAAGITAQLSRHDAIAQALKAATAHCRIPGAQHWLSA